MRCVIVFCLAALLHSSPGFAQTRVLLAAEDDWYPYSAKIDKHVEGRSVDVIRAAYEAAGATLTLDVVPFNRGVAKTKAGTFAGVFNAGLNEAVRKEFLVPRHYLALSEQMVIARKGEPFLDQRSFIGRRLTLTLGYTYPTGITSNRQIKIERSVQDINNLRKIAAGRADFTIIDRLVGLSLLAKEPKLKEQLEMVGHLHTEEIYVLFAKSDDGKEALALFDQGMDIISRNGTLKAIADRWEAKLR